MKLVWNWKNIYKFTTFNLCLSLVWGAVVGIANMGIAGALIGGVAVGLGSYWVASKWWSFFEIV